MIQTTTSNIFTDGVLVDVSVSFWTGSKILTAADLGLTETEVSDAYKLGKKFLIPPEVVRRFRTVENRARAIVNRDSFNFPFGNARFVPRTLFPQVLAKLQECQNEYMSLVDDLILKYADYREQMLPVYKEAADTAFINQTPDTQTFGIDYDREAEKEKFIQDFMTRINSYYPPVETLHERFSLSWSVYEIALPRMHEGDANMIASNQVVQEDYRKQMHLKISDFVTDVVSVLRQDTVKICTRIADNIKEGKIIRGTTMESLRSFIDRFSNLNFVGDTLIENQLASLRKEILDTNPNTSFAENVELKEELGRRLNMVAEAASQITDINNVTGEYNRKINWK